jgi:mannose-1-phosphate guanylyltransferase
MSSHTYAVIMAGGRGTRFWPLSRRNRAKQFLEVAPGGTLIQKTLARIEPLIPSENVLVVLGQDQREEAMRQLPGIPSKNFVVEPLGRNTAPAIGLAALSVRERDPEGVMVVLPADHLIGDEEEFRHVLEAAARMASQSTRLVVLGIRPSRPETGYGYIQPGDPIAGDEDQPVHAVRRFVEKPSRQKAEEYVDRGYLWNSGMFVWRASTIQDQFSAHLPELKAGLDRIGAARAGAKRARVVEDIYPTLESISIDYGVMEKSTEAVVIPCEFGWNDVGSWSALASIWKKDDAGNSVRGRVVTLDSARCVVSGEERLVALIDMEDVIVIDTPDAVLICPATSDQKVRDLVNLLEVSSLDRHL